MNEFLF